MAQGPRPSHPTPVLLSGLAQVLGTTHEGADETVTGVAVHTSGVQPGDLFVALPGALGHGIDFWPDARAAGARAVLTDQRGRESLGDPLHGVIVVPAPRDVVGLVAAHVYGTAAVPDIQIFAVTGTNGKTSTAFLLEGIMRALGWTTALSTTAERAVAGVPYTSTLTTPEAPDIHAMIALAREQGATGLAIEVSAQALDKNRLDHIMVDVAGFTNLSHDHFEDFGDMDTYLAAKAVLFTAERATRAVVCVDSPWGQALAAGTTLPLWTLGALGTEPVGPAPHWTYRVDGSEGDSTHVTLASPEGETLAVVAPVIGDHMVANAALALTMVLAGGVELERMREVFADTPIPVFLPGRMERVSGETGPQVFVDAGRSEDAYRVTLNTLRSRTPGQLIMVCGTSGNRDATKRPLMGRAAAIGADVVIVTDDDPRKEDPAAIRRGLLEGARSVSGAEVLEIPDPSAAIRRAIAIAGPGDCVVWCGPGSQSYRDIDGHKIPYSAREESRRALTEAGWPHG